MGESQSWNKRKIPKQKHDRLQPWMKLSECVETCMMKFFKKIHFLIKMRLPSIFEQYARIFKSNGIKLQLFRQLTDSKTKIFSS